MKMREILFMGQTLAGVWVEGYLFIDQKGAAYILDTNNDGDDGKTIRYILVKRETVRQYTGLTDKNGTKIFEGDIVQYNTFNDFDCQSVVKFGEYKQDGSANEYSSIECIGFYVEVDNFTCPDWCENEPECFPEYLNQQNILEVASNCEVIGNIHDNPEFLKGGAEK